MLTVVVSCSEDDPGSDSKTYPEAVLSISNASSLAVLEADAGRVTAGGSNLYKITTNGSMEEVKFVNADGSDIDPAIAETTIQVSNVVTLDATIFLLEGTFSVWDSAGVAQHYDALLVRRSDGAIFDFGENDISYNKTKLGDKLVKTDVSQNLYYPNNTGITKLSNSNPEIMTKQEFLSTGQTAEYFEITRNGAAIYKYGSSSGVTNANGTDDLRIRKAGGGIFEVKVEGRDNREFWRGANGSIYFVTYTWDNGYQSAIHKITMVDDNPVIEEVWSDDSMEHEFNYVAGMLRTASQGSHKIDKENSVVFIATYAGGGFAWEFNEETNTVEDFTLPDVEEGAIIVNSDNNYYIATGTDLYKVDLDTHEYSSLLNSGEYEVYSMNVDANDNIQFSGLRFSDGRKVFAKISPSGNVEVIDEEIGRSATVLQRLDQ